MWEYLVELFEKPAIMLTTLEQIILLAIIVVGLIIVFAIICGIIALAETIQERKERKEWLGTIKERLEALGQENKDLKEIIEIRKQMNINLIDFSTKLKQENEKLKKTLSIIRNKCYSLQLTEATDEEFNLIKEVLGE